jgi:hypothetical protein
VCTEISANRNPLLGSVTHSISLNVVVAFGIGKHCLPSPRMTALRLVWRVFASTNRVVWEYGQLGPETARTA